MIDQLSPTIRKLLLADTEDELFTVATTEFDRLLDADQSTGIPAADCSDDAQAWASTGSLDISQQEPLISGIIGQSYASGETQIVGDLLETRSASSHSQQSHPAQYRSLLCVPVAEFGVLVAVDHEATAFSDTDVEAVEFLQSFIAAAANRIMTTNANQGPTDQVHEFTRILAHDIRNPLSVANGRLELARKEHDSTHLEHVSIALQRIDDLIDDVLLLAGSGEDLDVEPVNIKITAEQAWSMVEADEAEQTIDDSLVILADKSLVFQLFENLFRNAVTHGGPAVSINVGLLADETGFYVADDGPGIPADKRETIFDSGYSSETKRKGLGMYIIKKIIDVHGWEITVTESIQGGARFEIADIETEEST